MLYAFSGSPDGSNPEGGVIVDASGDILGTTYQGGASSGSGLGTVFELKPSGDSFAESIVYTFNGSNGAFSSASPIEDSKGDLFVTTSQGGQNGNGTATELAPSGGAYQAQAFYTFPSNGCSGPAAPLLLHGKTFYATDAACGVNGKGFIAALSATGLAGSDVYDFKGAPDGNEPIAPLVFAKGAFYGTTYLGGSSTACPSGCGTVFKFVPGKKGGGTETVLWDFGGPNTGGGDGAFPTSSVTVDKNGTLYGTTSQGGANGYGTVFALTPSGNGYSESILHSFSGSAIFGPDGGNPFSGLTLKGSLLYGTTSTGGTSSCCGTIFQIGPTGNNYQVLYSFSGSEGSTPYYGNLFLKGNALYGTTRFGGNSEPNCNESACGVVYRFTL